jgi:hypothetical protein
LTHEKKGGAERRLARLRRALHESILLVVLAVAVGDWTHLAFSGLSAFSGLE